MAKSRPTQPGLFAAAPFAFADRFLQDHAGQIISEPRTAILELIANSYDAGATKIDIIWPTEKGQKFSVTDDGIGMTRTEFEMRWRTLCYNREAEQGNEVVFPKSVKGIKRTAFGRSGKGRHAPFCFADSYEISTMKDGDFIQVRVGLGTSGTTPFEITLISESKKRGHGTEISAILDRHLLGVDELRQLIGSKFIVDPSLCIRVNQQPVELMSLEGLKTTEIALEGDGTVTVHFIDSIEHYRSAKLRGISWWVNQRRVGEPSWDRLDDEGAYLDGRTEHAKKFSFIVMADFLTPGQDVKADWSDFHANQRTNAMRDAVHRYVIKEIQAQLATTRKERKKSAIENSYVLGATLEGGLESADYGGNTRIIPTIYQTVLRKAHQRTFNLQKRLQEVQPALVSDPEVEAVLRVDHQPTLFEEVPPKTHAPASPNGTPKTSETAAQPEGKP